MLTLCKGDKDIRVEMWKLRDKKKMDFWGV